MSLLPPELRALFQDSLIQHYPERFRFVKATTGAKSGLLNAPTVTGETTAFNNVPAQIEPDLNSGGIEVKDPVTGTIRRSTHKVALLGDYAITEDMTLVKFNGERYGILQVATDALRTTTILRCEKIKRPL